MALTQKRVEDLDTLRAFTHPLRMRLLATLRFDGPATASDLGRLLGESSGATSYHLRQLARFGFIVEDDEQPSRRERRWRAAHELTSWEPTDFLDDPAARSVLRILARERIRFMVEQLRRWYEGRRNWSRAWVAAAQDSDMVIRMRPEDLDRMGREIWDVVTRYADAQRASDDPQAEKVVLFLHAMPARDVVA
ncbi:MAG TPA: helix-turn-helix domain-containing protein [Jiangellaceae bacterium]|nr:helix-turn-helix domain-containing protein [Jiangellaceae bacterium]